MSNSIQGRNVLITGATKGIGKSIAYALAKEGCNLMLSARTTQALADLQKELSSLYPAIQIQYMATDCGDMDQVKKLAAEALAHFNQIDILVNNVGVFIPSGFLDEAAESFANHMAVNVSCMHYLSVYFGKGMCKRGSGHVFNAGSIAGKSPFVKAASYSVTKYAVHGLTSVLREEFGPYGVKVTEIIPGSTFTSSWEGVTIPEERFVAATDIAQAVIACLNMSKGANVDEIVITPLHRDV
ncbi:MAG TPA: SDR family NAD(P)-dependent oxidoreductase [Pseudosphingobacterium sp.]|nr:SDR family NAD(P)-dependent oxidoreductase [Pseudosphingobacterium sp.]